MSLTAFLFAPVMHIYADSPDPNLTSINETYVWRNVLESDDYLLIAKYSVIPGTNETVGFVSSNSSYSINTTDDISDMFTFRLMDVANTNELGVVEAYPYQDDGWGQGVISFYFPASTSPAWGSSLWIRIEGKATKFSSPPIYSFNVPAISYSTLTDQEDIRKDIAIKVIDIAQTVGRSWFTVQSLTEETESGTVLSQSGESYLRQVIPGIQALCPNLFILQILDTISTNTTWSLNQSEKSAALVTNSSLANGITGMASLFDMSFSAVASIPIVIVCIALIVIGAIQGNVLSGFINSSIILSSASLFGWFPMGVLMLISFACGIFILFHLIYKGSN